MHFSTTSPNFIQILTLCIAGMSYFLFGMSTSWTSTSIPRLMSNEYNIYLTPEQGSYLVMISSMSMIISSIIASILMNVLGRKSCLLLSALPSFLCYLTIIFAKSLDMFYIARAFSGFCDGIVSTIMPAFIGEISSPKVRGVWGPVPLVLYVVGELFINCVGGYTTIETTAKICCIIPILYFVIFSLMPESPYFYIMRNRDEDARNVLKKLYWKDDIENEFNELKNHVLKDMDNKVTLLQIFIVKPYLKALSIVLYMRFVQFLTGLYIFMTLAGYFFQLADTSLSPRTSTIIFFSVSVITNCATCLFINKMGRRISTLLSTLGSAITLLIIALYFWIRDHTDLDLSGIQWFPLLVLLVYLVMIALGISATPTIMASELFSPQIKHYGLCILNFTYAIYIGFGVMYFNILFELFGMYFPFAILSGSLFISFIITIIILPETKNKTLEEIQMILKGQQ